MENNALKVLMTTSEPLPETEDEYDGNDSLIESAEMNSAFIDIIDSIGKDDFQWTYIELIKQIRDLPIKDQIKFSHSILLKIEEFYKFEFMEKIELLSGEDVENVYKLLEFLEFDNIDFLVTLLEGIIEDIRKEPIRIIYDTNWIEIESRILKGNYSRLISLFLRTNTKEGLLDFLVEKTMKNKVLITMKLFRRRMENGNSNN